MRNRSRPPAFTLVEMLVVIGIIGLLIGLLLPALLTARQAGKKAACLANLRNVSNGIQVYIANNHGAFTIGTTAEGAYYGGAVSDYKDNGYNSNAARTRVCPAMVDYYKTSLDAALATTSYGFNPWLYQVQANGGTIKVSRLLDTGNLVMMADVIKTDAVGMVFNASDGLQPAYAASYSTAQPPALTRPTFHGRHGGNGSVLWMDGHASVQTVTAVPANAPVGTAYNSILQPPGFYNKLHIGYLTRSASDLNSMACEYYFVSRKDLLSKNDINVYFVYSTAIYPPGWVLNKALW